MTIFTIIFTKVFPINLSTSRTTERLACSLSKSPHLWICLKTWSMKVQLLETEEEFPVQSNWHFRYNWYLLWQLWFIFFFFCIMLISPSLLWMVHELRSQACISKSNILKVFFTFLLGKNQLLLCASYVFLLHFNRSRGTAQVRLAWLYNRQLLWLLKLPLLNVSQECHASLLRVITKDFQHSNMLMAILENIWCIMNPDHKIFWKQRCYLKTDYYCCELLRTFLKITYWET